MAHRLRKNLLRRMDLSRISVQPEISLRFRKYCQKRGAVCWCPAPQKHPKVLAVLPEMNPDPWTHGNSS